MTGRKQHMKGCTIRREEESAPHARAVSADGGFTLVEVIIASSLFFGIFGLVISVYLNTLEGTHAGLSQMDYTTSAQLSEQKMVRYVEKSKFFNCVSGNEIVLYTPNPSNGALEKASLLYTGRYDDRYLENSAIYYVRTNDYGHVLERTALVKCVTAISNQPIFSKQGKSVCVNYQVGDPADSERESSSGPGYQGQEVRFYVTPRNLQTWFD